MNWPRADAPHAYDYEGSHPIPPGQGGGWCLLEGAHSHPYAPDYDSYVFAEAGYVYQGPVDIAYTGYHPLPTGGFCGLLYRHRHAFRPSGGASVDWTWNAANGFTFHGQQAVAALPLAVTAVQPLVRETSRGVGGYIGAPAPPETSHSPARLSPEAGVAAHGGGLVHGAGSKPHAPAPAPAVSAHASRGKAR